MNKRRLVLCLLSAGLAAAVALGTGLAVRAAAKPKENADGLGYTSTPLIPGQKWRVHDRNRPHPPVITPPMPPREKPASPPSDAIVLFDGKDLSKWQTFRKGKALPAGWKVTGGYMEIVPGSGSIFTKEEFGDFQLHVEWAAPVPARGFGQNRGNSGVILCGGRYEVQVLDSYGNKTYADGQAAAIYGQYPPDVNACRPPGQWQTYDIIFEAPRFENGKLKRPAYMTVFHNGVLVHNHRALLGQTAHKRVPTYHPHPPKGPIMLQDHGHRVRYRNIWLRPIKVEE